MCLYVGHLQTFFVDSTLVVMAGVELDSLLLEEASAWLKERIKIPKRVVLKSVRGECKG